MKIKKVVFNPNPTISVNTETVEVGVDVVTEITDAFWINDTVVGGFAYKNENGETVSCHVPVLYSIVEVED